MSMRTIGALGRHSQRAAALRQRQQDAIREQLSLQRRQAQNVRAGVRITHKLRRRT